jgi:hypothetical protein
MFKTNVLYADIVVAIVAVAEEFRDYTNELTIEYIHEKKKEQQNMGLSYT